VCAPPGETVSAVFPTGMNAPDVRGRVALITGGGQGIGRILAVSLAEMGVDVAVLARTIADVERTARAVRALRVRAEAVQADVSVRDEIEQAVAQVVDRFDRLDILIVAAGIYGPIGTVLEVDPAAWEEAIRINLLGTFYSVRAVLPTMLRQGRGKIVAFSGGGAVSVRPRFSGYATSKAGVVRLVETVAAEFADAGIDINAVAPGPVATRLHDEVLRQPERAGEAEVQKARQIQEENGGASIERLTGLVKFLVSYASNGLTGRLISAVWDNWELLSGRIAHIRGTDLYTVRRISG
jgi:NAD(P)-dependent dehydrogenase (short-subunit alcohol dehydrogenase family)